MVAPTLLPSRRFAQPVRTKLQVVYAKAFEALAETYSLQAAGFVRRLEGRLTFDDALDRYFREIPVPEPMRETVRARALIALNPQAEPEPESGESDSWPFLRPDLVVEAFRRRAQYVEEVNLTARLAASVAEEAVAATHVRMALAVAEVLGAELPPDEAVMHYVRTFDLPSLTAQMIFQRALAQLADRARPVPHEELPAPATAPAPVCLSGPAPVVSSVGAFGLRVMA